MEVSVHSNVCVQVIAKSPIYRCIASLGLTSRVCWRWRDTMTMITKMTINYDSRRQKHIHRTPRAAYCTQIAAYQYSIRNCSGRIAVKSLLIGSCGLQFESKQASEGTGSPGPDRQRDPSVSQSVGPRKMSQQAIVSDLSSL